TNKQKSNYRNGKLTTYFNTKEQVHVMHLMEPVKKGEQIYMYYGNRKNEDLLIHNGFIVSGNPNDKVELRLDLLGGDRLAKLKQFHLQNLKLPASMSCVITPPRLQMQSDFKSEHSQQNDNVNANENDNESDHDDDNKKVESNKKVEKPNLNEQFEQLLLNNSQPIQKDQKLLTEKFALQNIDLSKVEVGTEDDIVHLRELLGLDLANNVMQYLRIVCMTDNDLEKFMRTWIYPSTANTNANANANNTAISPPTFDGTQIITPFNEKQVYKYLTKNSENLLAFLNGRLASLIRLYCPGVNSDSESDKIKDRLNANHLHHIWNIYQLLSFQKSNLLLVSEKFKRGVELIGGYLDKAAKVPTNL
ncbi:SET domain-containing protein 3, partial [Reticulomyxa filosa]